MAAHVRHGPPGSFKSAAAVWFDVLKWLRQGREVYTNIRGMLPVDEIELILKETFPEGAAVYCIDTDSNEMRQYFAAFFHWLPPGAALVIDEAQFIYPARKDFKPESLDYPGGLDQATKDQRPTDIFTAIDKHRHYNWDICLTTPNIKKLPSWLRDTLEAGYHHKNMEHIPIYGKRKARIHKHDPSTTGTTITKQSEYSLQKIPVIVHQLYGSTITGEVTKNVASANPLKNPRFLGFLVIAGIAITASSCQAKKYFDGHSAADLPADSADSAQSDQSPASVVSQSPVEDNRLDSDNGGVSVASAPSYDMTAVDAFLPAAGHAVYIAASLHSEGQSVYLYRIYDGSGVTRVVPPSWFDDVGFEIAVHSPCHHDLLAPGASTPYRVVCEAQRERSSEPSGDDRASVAGAVSGPSFSTPQPFEGVF